MSGMASNNAVSATLALAEQLISRRTVTPADGVIGTEQESTMRIVSLLPSATEIVCALGLEQQLVGDRKSVV